jgi:fatty-acyl-CoA synthase
MNVPTASYVHGASPVPLSGLTVGGLLDRAADLWPDREALVVPHQDVRWSFAELRALADGLAAGLLGLGLVPGDRVGVLSPNRSEWVTIQFATARAGLVLVNINPAYRAPELRYALNKVGCKALIVAPRFKSSDYMGMLAELAPELETATPGRLAARSLPDLSWIVHLGAEPHRGAISYDNVVAGADARTRDRVRMLGATLQFDDPINIQFTSGTTGAPKAATLTHHNIVNNAIFVGRQMALDPGDRLCLPVPMYHCFGMVLGTLCTVACGAAVVLPSEGFDADATLRAIADERCSALHGVPTMFIAELDSPTFPRTDFSSLRTGIMAGAPCPEELMRRVMADMHLEQITIAYGMTETGPVSFQTAVDDPLEKRVGTVGRVLPHVEVKIVDPEGRVVPRGTAGELLTRGYCVMPGYWGDTEKTAEAIDPAHWIASGDVAVIEPDGYCRIVGRTKDMIIRGGENIFPREIEDFLYTHPKIEQVEVIGVPDPKYGEEVCAWIRLRDGETATADEIRAFCAERIAHFKIPRHIRFVETFPMTVTGKVQKFVMRQMMADERPKDPAARTTDPTGRGGRPTPDAQRATKGETS